VYIPTLFNQNEAAVLHEFMRAHSFATLVTAQQGVPYASHLPLFLRAEAGGQGALLGHMARANPQWQDMQAGAEVLVMFQGPHAYVSPAWYAAQELAVPTWNYMAVHAYGKARILTQQELELALHELVNSYESAYAQPWQLELTAAMRDKLVPAIVGFEIVIERCEGKFKLSQNRPAQDQQRVITQLAAQTDTHSQHLAAQMQLRLRKE